jgi:hypothetical protein
MAGRVHSGYGGTFHCRIEDGNLKPLITNGRSVMVLVALLPCLLFVVKYIILINSKNLVIQISYVRILYLCAWTSPLFFFFLFSLISYFTYQKKRKGRQKEFHVRVIVNTNFNVSDTTSLESHFLFFIFD